METNLIEWPIVKCDHSHGWRNLPYEQRMQAIAQRAVVWLMVLHERDNRGL